ncbi:MAG: spore germination protein [Acetivibrionales bacterium]
MTGFKKTVKSLLLFKEPEKAESFVLEETKREKEEIGDIEREEEKEGNKDNRNKKHHRIKNTGVGKVFIKQTGKSEEKQKIAINKDLSINLEYMKKVYSIPINGDIIIREFDVVFNDKPVSAFIIFYDGLTDRNVINNNILQPLMILSNLNIKSDEKNIGQYIRKNLLPQNQLKYTSVYEDIISEINFGGCGIFVDGLDHAFACDTKGWEHRGVERPNNELVLRGPQEGFNEVLRVNTGLVRKILKDEDLIAEDVAVGKISKTPCSIMYIKDIVNDSLVQEVRRRMRSIKADYVLDTGQLEQFLEDSTMLPAPLVIDTERPDRVASLLVEGKVAIIMNGSPFALVIPANATSLFHSAEDAYIRFPYVNFLRFIRLLAAILSLLLPGIYISIINFHHEMIPTDLLIAIGASRERVPFPSLVELLVMEFSFELIREAGIRVPGPIGPTLGIIGALILGQAAVAATIVSPILIIIVAVTGIGSFAIPSFSMAFSFRIVRIAYIILGAMAGFMGISLGLFVHALWLSTSKSFGVPFLAPFAPRTGMTMDDEITRAPIWKQESRPDYLNTKSTKKQPGISRGWAEEDKKKR